MFIEIISCKPVEPVQMSDNSAHAWDIKAIAKLNTLQFKISGRIDDPYPNGPIYDWVAKTEFLRRVNESGQALAGGTAAYARQAEENAKHY